MISTFVISWNSLECACSIETDTVLTLNDRSRRIRDDLLDEERFVGFGYGTIKP
jgi:hypothetical protein